MAIIEPARLGARARKFTSWILAGLGCLFTIGFAAPGKGEGHLQVEIFDHATGQPVHVRCYLTDYANKFWAPAGAAQYNKPPERHFIAAGKFGISLPPGQYKLQVERGLEYRAATR